MSRMNYSRVYDPMKYTRIAAFVFLAVLAGGFVMSLMQTTVMSYIFKGAVIRSAAGIFEPTSTIGYLVHNSSILFGSWLMGLSIVGPFAVLFENGMGIGAYVAESFVYMLNGNPAGVAQIAFIIPHGIFELTGIMISAGAGIYLARVTYDSIFEDVEADIPRALGRTLPYVFISFGLIIVAAVVESTISPEVAKLAVEVVY